MCKWLAFPNSSEIVRTEIFRAGKIVRELVVSRATYETALMVAEVTGEPVVAILRRYDRKLGEIYKEG